MKNITQQYQDLLEGKMSQATFMVNVRRQFPDWISSTNSLKDAVTILKGKRIITEVSAKQAFQADLAKDPEHQKQIQDKLTNKNYRGGKDYLDTRTVNVATEDPYINGKFEKNPKDDDDDLDTINAEALPEIGEGIHDLNITGGSGMAGYVDSNKQADAYNRSIRGPKSTTEKTIKTYTQNGDKSYDVTYSDGTKRTVMVSDDEWDTINAKAHPELKEAEKKPSAGLTKKEKSTIAKKAQAGGDIGKKGPGFAKVEKAAEKKYGSKEVGEKVAAAAMWKSQAKKAAIKEAEEKTEGKYKSITGKDLLATFREIDRVNPYEFKRGITVEMGMQYDPTPNFFTTKFNPETLDKATKKVMANLKKDPAYYSKSLDAATKEKFGMSTKAPEVPKYPDGMIKAKGLDKVAANTKTNLGNQEKRKGNPKGVKQLKEEFLREFAEPVEQKKSRFSIGHKVHTPEGRVGTIEELDHAGTATVVHEDGSKQDYQQNVLNDFGHLDGKVEKDISGKIIRATNKDGIVLTMNDKADHNGEPIEIGSFIIKGSKVLAKSKAGSEIDIDDLKKVERGPRPGVALGQGTDKMGKLKEMMKKMMDEIALVVPRGATQQQIDQLAQKDMTIKPGTHVDIIHK